jgi:hypothetical protein
MTWRGRQEYSEMDSKHGTVASLLLQEKDGRYFWSVAYDRGGDAAVELVGRDYPDVHEARDAAYRFTQEHYDAAYRFALKRGMGPDAADRFACQHRPAIHRWDYQRSASSGYRPPTTEQDDEQVRKRRPQAPRRLSRQDYQRGKR